MVMKISIESLVADLSRLGVRQGDVIYVRSKASAVGRVHPKEALLKALLQIIGPEGTLICPAFTSPSYRWSRTKTIFSATTPTESGALSRLALEYPGAIRSKHPTHSFVAIGPAAPKILLGHDHSTAAFYPVEKMIEYQAKMLLIGCSKESPGFSTVHYAQERLGLSQQHLTKYFFGARIELSGKIIDWHPLEDPGCSRGFDKMYRHYLHAQTLETGWVGKAFTMIGFAEGLYAVDLARLREDPREVLCDRLDCVSCRILRLYNMLAMPKALLRRILRNI
jgi:aminoglycoside 3-N-acetyltransferase